jgi:hypothetical protein
MAEANEFAVRVEFRRGDDGRCYIGSPDIVGLHLAGHDIEALRHELEPIIKDLIWYNLDRVIDRFHWIPSLEEIGERFNSARRLDDERTELCVISLKAA